MKIEQGVPKRRHIKSRRSVLTQKKAYNIELYSLSKAPLFSDSMSYGVDNSSSHVDKLT